MYALEKINQITHKFEYESYADLANKLGLRVVHISERDSHITNKPKKRNEYVNTWASDAVSWYDEAFGPLEISWGTHEKTIPDNIDKNLSNEYQIVLGGTTQCYNTWAYSYTPVGKNLVGMIIRHEECYNICKILTLKNDKNDPIYKPSCYYVYKPCDSAVASTYEVRDNLEVYQTSRRLMTSDIIEGNDELGCTLFFANGDIYWIGSLLDIEEARFIYDNNYNHIINSTILQVVAGYVGAILYLIECIENKKYSGLLNPEELPIRKFVKLTKPLLGSFRLIKVDDWTVNSNPDCMWQFDDFVF